MACFLKVPSLYRHKSLSKAKIQRILVQLLTPYPVYFVFLTEICIPLLTNLSNFLDLVILFPRPSNMDPRGESLETSYFCF